MYLHIIKNNIKNYKSTKLYLDSIGFEADFNKNFIPQITFPYKYKLAYPIFEYYYKIY